MPLGLLLLVAILSPGLALAVEYNCNVEKKLDSARVYTEEQVKKGKFSLKIEESGGGTFVSRCSYSEIANRVTCDRYQADKVMFDENVKIKKYYFFQSQFDVQLFPDLSFAENNGRGGIAYGKCRIISP